MPIHLLASAKIAFSAQAGVTRPVGPRACIPAMQLSTAVKEEVKPSFGAAADVVPVSIQYSAGVYPLPQDPVPSPSPTPAAPSPVLPSPCAAQLKEMGSRVTAETVQQLYASLMVAAASAEAASIASDTVSKVDVVEVATTAPRVASNAAMEPPKWNPNKVTSLGPIDLKKYCIPEYLTNAPCFLDGSLPCDFGFDPLCLAALARPPADLDRLIRLARESTAQRNQRMLSMSKEEQEKSVMWMREAELKHSRLAMLAVVGWPLAELEPFAKLALSSTNGRAPSLFNGGLLDFPTFPAFVFAFLAIAIVEANTIDNMEIRGRPIDVKGLTRSGYNPGDLGFDPFELYKYEGAYTQRLLRNGEVFNGRLACLAITGFAVQEYVFGVPVVQQTPIFF